MEKDGGGEKSFREGDIVQVRGIITSVSETRVAINFGCRANKYSGLGIWFEKESVMHERWTSEEIEQIKWGADQMTQDLGITTPGDEPKQQSGLNDGADLSVARPDGGASTAECPCTLEEAVRIVQALKIYKESGQLGILIGVMSTFKTRLRAETIEACAREAECAIIEYTEIDVLDRTPAKDRIARRIRHLANAKGSK